MTTNIKATGLTLTDEIRSYIDKCLHKVEKYVHDESAATAQVEIERLMSHESGEMYRGEFTLSGAGLSVRAEAEGATLHAAIDSLENKIISELRKGKGKRIHMFRREGQRIKNWLRFGRGN